MPVKILFLLPNNASKPVGGIKVVLEYANRLVRDGYDVSLVYAAYNRWYKSGLGHLLYYFLRLLTSKTTKSYVPKWFAVDKRVAHSLVWAFDKCVYPKDAKVIATAVDTACYLERWSIPSEQKFYFIQDFENWFVSDDFVRQTYHYEMTKIVVSKWLKRIVNECGEEATLVLNGFDMDFFHLTKPICDRNRHEIICLYHEDRRKGLSMAFEAFDIAKKNIPELHVTLFGAPNMPIGLPAWYSYYQRPDKETFNEIYNRSAIFVGSSTVEGWGLTVGEAMLCGCAVACTDNDGYLEMAIDGKTALVSHVNDARAMARNIVKLVQDDALRINIAENGHRHIRNFDIEHSYQLFKETLNGTE